MTMSMPATTVMTTVPKTMKCKMIATGQIRLYSDGYGDGYDDEYFDGVEHREGTPESYRGYDDSGWMVLRRCCVEAHLGSYEVCDHS